MHAKMCINDAKIFLLASCKNDSSIIDEDSYRDELLFLWALANSSLVYRVSQKKVPTFENS